jgi:hypothetical protein
LTKFRNGAILVVEFSLNFIWRILSMGNIVVAGKAVWGAVKAVGGWVALNPDIMMNAADKVIKFKTDDKVNQLGAAVVEIDQKFTAEMETLRKEIRTLKIMLYTLAGVLGAAVVAIILLAIL